MNIKRIIIYTCSLVLILSSTSLVANAKEKSIKVQNKEQETYIAMDEVVNEMNNVDTSDLENTKITTINIKTISGKVIEQKVYTLFNGKKLALADSTYSLKIDNINYSTDTGSLNGYIIPVALPIEKENDNLLLSTKTVKQLEKELGMQINKDYVVFEYIDNEVKNDVTNNAEIALNKEEEPIKKNELPLSESIESSPGSQNDNISTPSNESAIIESTNTEDSSTNQQIETPIETPVETPVETPITEEPIINTENKTTAINIPDIAYMESQGWLYIGSVEDGIKTFSNGEKEMVINNNEGIITFTKIYSGGDDNATWSLLSYIIGNDATFSAKSIANGPEDYHGIIPGYTNIYLTTVNALLEVYY